MIPGQLRPTFAHNDRAKRVAIFIVALVLGVGGIIGVPSISRWLPFMIALVVMFVALQIVYFRRIHNLRRVAARIAEQHPGSRVYLGNVHLGPSDVRLEAEPFTTTVLEVTSSSLQLWNPDAPQRPYWAIPLHGIKIDVMETSLPRLRLAAPHDGSVVFLALFRRTGLSFVRVEDLRAIAAEMAPTGEDAVSS